MEGDDPDSSAGKSGRSFPLDLNKAPTVYGTDDPELLSFADSLLQLGNDHDDGGARDHHMPAMVAPPRSQHMVENLHVPFGSHGHRDIGDTSKDATLSTNIQTQQNARLVSGRGNTVAGFHMSSQGGRGTSHSFASNVPTAIGEANVRALNQYLAHQRSMAALGGNHVMGAVQSNYPSLRGQASNLWVGDQIVPTTFPSSNRGGETSISSHHSRMVATPSHNSDEQQASGNFLSIGQSTSDLNWSNDGDRSMLGANSGANAVPYNTTPITQGSVQNFSGMPHGGITNSRNINIDPHRGFSGQSVVTGQPRAIHAHMTASGQGRSGIVVQPSNIRSQVSLGFFPTQQRQSYSVVTRHVGAIQPHMLARGPGRPIMVAQPSNISTQVPNMYVLPQQQQDYHNSALIDEIYTEALSWGNNSSMVPPFGGTFGNNSSSQVPYAFVPTQQQQGYLNSSQSARNHSAMVPPSGGTFSSNSSRNSSGHTAPIRDGAAVNDNSEQAEPETKNTPRIPTKGKRGRPAGSKNVQPAKVRVRPSVAIGRPTQLSVGSEHQPEHLVAGSGRGRPSEVHVKPSAKNRKVSPALVNPHASQETAKIPEPSSSLADKTVAVYYIKREASPDAVVEENCRLCKRDLRYAPTGPISEPTNRPEVAVLPCGHTFHDECLQKITPPEESKKPPCIPCALGDR